MKRENQIYCEGIDLGDGAVIEEADEEGYKYLGILERDDICQERMKEKVQKEYYKRVRAVNTINIWAVVTVWYGAGIINWNKGESDKIE